MSGYRSELYVRGHILREFAEYDPHTGVIFRRRRPRSHFASDREYRKWNTRWANTEAFGYVGDHGYKSGQFDGKILKAHRVAWFLHNGKWPEDQIDHINGDRSDNRIENLREVSNQENCRNSVYPSKIANSKTGVQGVSIAKTGKFIAYINIGSKGRTHLGTFGCKTAAIFARISAEMAHGYTRRKEI